MHAEIVREDGHAFLLVKVPLQPEQSKSGKFLHLHSTHGWVETDLDYEGKRVQASMNIGVRV